jgi:hypothetical protein
MTSPPPPDLDEQVILELEVGVVVDEAVSVLLGGRSGGLPLPMNQELANTSGQAGTDDAFRFLDGGAIVDRR